MSLSVAKAGAGLKASEASYKVFADLLQQTKTTQTPDVGEVIEGVVVGMNKGEALVDFGGKAEGIVQGKELVDSSMDDDISIGGKILAIVLIPEDEEGRAILSIRRARAERKWREMKDRFEDKSPVKVTIVQPNKGGLIVNAEGLQGFVPISQLGPTHYPSNIQKGPGFADAAIAYLTQFIGQGFDTQIIEYERGTNRLILSERVLLQRTKGFEPLEDLDFKVGDGVSGKVVAIKDFGVFVDLGKASGLVHISEMSWDRVNHPGDIVKVGQTVEVKVIGIDEGGRRVSLSMKQLSDNPWIKLSSKYQMGQVIKGIVTKIVDYGAFVQLEAGFDGLVHISELSPFHVKDPADVLQEGQEAKFKIILLDRDNQRLGLSYRQANPDLFPESEDKDEAKDKPVDAKAETPVEAKAAAPVAAVAAEPVVKAVEPVVAEVKAEEAPKPKAKAAIPEKAKPSDEDKQTAIKELMLLDGVGEVVAGKLFDAGYNSIVKVASSSVAELSLIPGIRMASADKIKKAAENHT